MSKPKHFETACAWEMGPFVELKLFTQQFVYLIKKYLWNFLEAIQFIHIDSCGSKAEKSEKKN